MPSRSDGLCPVCAGHPQFLYTIDRFSKPFDILRCPDCGLEMQAQIPEDASSLYTEDYYTGRSEYAYRDERKRLHFDRFVWNARLKNIARFVPPPADFLDVGCAFGGLVEAAGTLGYNASGIDISADAVRSARARGIDAQLGRLDADLFPGRQFHVVTMIEVMEHLERPREALKTLSRLVRPGGVVVIQTANYEGMQARTQGRDYHYYLPGHFFYYGVSNLRRLLSEHGFTKTRLYRPVDFGLLPKLQKSRGDFTRASDYLRWLRIAWYHYKSRIAWGSFSLTSSMVLYAFRDQSGPKLV
ncbi:MAG: class I SAM-dependent methyltransferase [Spirochaetia bacterium]|nr:class I SAM-dependent methyltransferase [Spirochaetia bacterium]